MAAAASTGACLHGVVYPFLPPLFSLFILDLCFKTNLKERILDLAAAPGGKTSYVAQLMKNSGTLVANDLKRDRLKSTVANLHRLGVQNTVRLLDS